MNCLDPVLRPRDALFRTAFTFGLQILRHEERRGGLAGVVGHVAESVIEVVLAEFGWSPVWHLEGPGRHGVDLLLLDPRTEYLFAVEVKGTLDPHRWPRIRSAEVAQMGAKWLDKRNNPGMTEWELTAADIYGAAAVVNFSRRAVKLAASRDFATWHPIIEVEQLDDVEWLVA